MSTVETITPRQEHWDRLPNKQAITRTIEALKNRGINTELVDSPREALRLITTKIPDGAQIMTGASTTLDEIGFTELQATGAEYFIGSIQAIAETGEVVVVSASGSQIPAYAFNARNIVWVVGTQKIVPSLEEALRRVREHALPLESARMKTQGFPGSIIGKILILEREVPQLGRNLTMILVNEKLGF